MDSRFNDREPQIHKIIDRSKENDSFVQIKEVAIAFEILRFSAAISVKRLKNVLLSLPFLHWRWRLTVWSWHVQHSTHVCCNISSFLFPFWWSFSVYCGSCNADCYGQRSLYRKILTIISSFASSPIFAVFSSIFSPVSLVRSGSFLTSLQTSSRKEAVISLTSLCRRVIKLSFLHDKQGTFNCVQTWREKKILCCKEKIIRKGSKKIVSKQAI